MSIQFYLMGMKHCGKSTVGREAARQLHLGFDDLDDAILSWYRSFGPVQEGFVPCTVRALYRRHGGSEFRRFEAEATKWLVDSRAQKPRGRDFPAEEQPGSENSPDKEQPRARLIALGGGTVENREAMDALSGTGRFVYLHVEVETLYRRIIRKGVPPFLDENDPHGSFAALYERRCRSFEEVADVTIDLSGLDRQAASHRLADVLEGYIDARK